MDGSAGFVGPFTGRLVRPERAAYVVAPMREGTDRAPEAVDATAYDEAVPAVYRYRQRTAGGDHTGLVVSMGMAAFADGRVRGHEDVQPGRVEALVEHLRTKSAPIELVTTVHRPGPRFIAALACDAGPALIDVETVDGHRQTVWRLTHDPGLLPELDAAQHYVADGHHRVAASRALWETAGRPGDRSLVVVAFADTGLRLAAFDRLLPGPVDSDAKLDRLRAHYDVAEDDAPLSGPWDMRVRVARRWYAARRRTGGPPSRQPIGAVLLDAALAPTALEPVRTGVADLQDRADRTGGAAFVLAPPSLEDVLDIADAGRTVPAKTTFFSPKPASGIFRA